MRIAFVTAARRWTGGERCMTAVAAGLARRGHDVVLTYDPRGPVGERLPAGVPAVAVPVRGDFDPAAVARLRQVLRAQATDVVCVNRIRELRVGGLAARLAGSARVVNRFGGMDALRNRWRDRLLYAALLDAVVRDCDWGCQLVRQRNPWFRGPLLRARNGVDVDALAAIVPADRAELGAGPDELLICALGRVEARKGSLELATAAAQLPAAAPAVRLVFIGAPGSGVREEVERRLDGRAAVSFLGERTPSEALRLAAGCNVLVHPTHADSFNYAVLEGTALGLPVVASRIGGLEEAVADGVTGILVPPGDAAALAEALADLALDPALRRRLGEAGRRRARREFSEERMLDEYELAFERVLASAPRRARR